MIFYQDTIKLNEDNNEIDRTKKYKKLKFEVRLPQSTLEKLAIMSLGIIQTGKNALNAIKGKNDESTTRACMNLIQN